LGRTIRSYQMIDMFVASSLFDTVDFKGRKVRWRLC
jgi:hypothetical protein